VSPEERDIVLAECLSNEANLGVALRIGMGFDDLRCRIISGFADCVCSRLRERFGESWRVGNEMGVEGYLQKAGSLWAVRRIGRERICVKLMYDRSPEKMYYAILDEEAPEPPTIDWQRIKQELDKRFAVGQAKAGCRWMSLVDPAYANWYDLEVLLKLWKKDEAATYFTNRLSAIMGIIASVVQGR
jgi:hypothetical protein